ncbi:unnamed protein product [Phytophthora fragariaefolia]|uniref:Unnamed protein product n=1 Tax=Phytophthora fragariaefolia TaxID=1490495 RepID=A0A9W6YFK1_9STRA|nr:unnamed protein product [Phytophthora fragariaefolia]
MPKPTNKGKKAQRAAEATPKVSASRTEKSSPKKTSPTTETVPNAKQTRWTRASKRTEVRLPGPYVEPDASGSDTDTPNPDLVTGDEDSGPDTTAPRASKPSEDRVADANTAASEAASAEEDPVPRPKDTSDTRKAEDVLNARSSQEPSEWASASTPAEVPQGQS